MLIYNDIIDVAKKYLEIPDTDTATISIIETFIKKIVYPTLCNYTYRKFHLAHLTGYCDSGINTQTTIVLPANASNIDDFYNGLYVEAIEGFLAGERKKIIDYDATTRTITTEAFSNIPDASTRFVILVNEDESFINTENVFIDNYVVYPPEQLTPIISVSPNSPQFSVLTPYSFRFDTDAYDLYKIYNITHIYGFKDVLNDISSIIIMVLQDFWKRKGKHGLQGVNSKTINLEDTLVEVNYLKEIFTTSYKLQLSKYIVPYERRIWM